jgi:hypothetical protein
VVKGFAALPGGLDGYLEVGLEEFLAHVVLEPAGAQAGVQVVFFLDCS